jgi:lipopolysaccharide transport system ATP-binding protein
MSQIAIKVEGLSKSYRIKSAQQRHDTLRDQIAAMFRSRSQSTRERASATDTVWALKDVSFEVQKGEVLGIIGRNGAGKTTLLKLLSRITEPSAGRAIMHGRVGSLLEVGTGFHPELTGRENTYLNAAILGMSRKEIERKFDEIVEFSGVQKFIDTPVKRYSSGMYVRLAFAVAAHLEPEILVVDEVLAVGDAAFQKKCLGKMDKIAKGGRTVLFVSHNMPAVSSLCNRAIWIDAGQLNDQGPTASVVASYLRSSHSKHVVNLSERTDRFGNGQFRFSRIWVTNGTGGEIDCILTGEDAHFFVEYEAPNEAELRNVLVTLVVRDLYGQILFSLSTHLKGQNFTRLDGSGTLTCKVPAFPLAPDTYIVDMWASHNGEPADSIETAFQFNVLAGDFYGSGVPIQRKNGAFVVDHTWSHETPVIKQPAELTL